MADNTGTCRNGHRHTASNSVPVLDNRGWSYLRCRVCDAAVSRRRRQMETDALLRRRIAMLAHLQFLIDLEKRYG